MVFSPNKYGKSNPKRGKFNIFTVPFSTNYLLWLIKRYILLFFHHCFLDLMGRGNQTKQIRGTQEIRDSKYFLLCMIHRIMPHPKKVIGGGGMSLAHSALSYTISNIYIYIYIKYIFYTFYLQYFVLHILLLSSKILTFFCPFSLSILMIVPPIFLSSISN